MSILSITGLSIAFGDHTLLENSNITLELRQKAGLIGRNGEGKSTLLKIIAGQVNSDAGDIRQNPGVRIAMLGQDPEANQDGTIFEAVAQGIEGVGNWLAEYQHISAQEDIQGEQLARLGELQKYLDSCDGWNLQAKVNKTLSRLDLEADTRVDTLSGGWQRRVALARALVCDPDILLLDEPTNHLDLASIIWLEKQILNFQGAVVFVTHDRQFLQNVATQIMELDRGNLVTWPGTYQDYLTRKAAALGQEEQQNKVFDQKLAKEEIWIRQGIKARRTRNEGRVRTLQKLRLAQSERRARKGDVNLRLEQSHQSGKLVIEAENINFNLDGKDIIKDFSTRIIRGDRIGLIGPNGIGKTTLLRILLKDLEPTIGEVSHGTRMDLAYFDQLRKDLNPDQTVIDVISEGREQVTINGKSKHVISYLSDFLFTPQRARSPIKALSGGEKARVLLAKLFSKPTNVLVMDEPTNDLDIETLELLEELLLKFDGTLLMVSHDRKFLDNVITSTISFEGNGSIREYVGGYSDWLRQQRTRSTDNSPRRQLAGSKPNHGTQKTPTQNKQKLSYNDQRELELLPGKIESLEAEQDELTQSISNSDFYRQPKELVNVTLERMKCISDTLAQHYQRWSELDP